MNLKVFETKGKTMLRLRDLVLGIQFFLVILTGVIVMSNLTKVHVHVLLFGAGIGTLIFYLITRKEVPLFLGPSLAFLSLITERVGTQPIPPPELAAAAILGGIFYVLISIWIKRIGLYKVMQLFPPIVAGNIIILIGASLVRSGVILAETNKFVATATMAPIILIYFFVPKLRKYAVIIGIVFGWIVALLFPSELVPKAVTPPEHLEPFLIPRLVMPKFTVKLVGIIMIGVLAPLLEHIGDVFAISNVADRPYYFKPGLDRTLLGNGIGNIVSGFLGVWGLTTYSQGTGTYLLMREYRPIYVLIAAIISLVVSSLGPLSRAIYAFPAAVIGGLMIYMFGFVASIGINVLIANRVDMQHPRNLFITALMLGIGLGETDIVIFGIPLNTLAVAGIVGIFLNWILPKKRG